VRKTAAADAVGGELHRASAAGKAGKAGKGVEGGEAEKGENGEAKAKEVLVNPNSPDGKTRNTTPDRKE
jgi:hypothetical protein